MDLETKRAKQREATRRYLDKKDPGRKRFVPCRIDDDGRECPHCREYKMWDQFHRFKSGNGRGEVWICKACRRETTRKSRYLRLYGITVEEFEQLEADQGGVCALCGEPEDKRHPKSGELFYLCVDHDHACDQGHVPERACKQCIRGLTCYGCNQFIGYAERRKTLRGYIADYLVRRPLFGDR